MRSVPESVLQFFAEVYGTTPGKLVKFGGGDESSDGVVYLVSHSGQPALLVKILHYAGENRRVSLLQAQERLRFLDYLGQHGVHVVRVRPGTNGEVFMIHETPDGIWMAYAMEKAPGKTPYPKVWDPPMFRTWGALIGQCHRVGQSYPHWRESLDPETGRPFLTWLNEWQSFYEWDTDDVVREGWQRIRDELETFPITRDAFGFIHNDPHIWNLQASGKSLMLLDFDVANHHWFANDIAIACQHVLMQLSGGLTRPMHHPDRLNDFLKAFLDGYRQENRLDQVWLQRLETFFAYRRILLYLVMAGWRQKNPTLQHSWTKMIIEQPRLLSSFKI